MNARHDPKTLKTDVSFPFRSRPRLDILDRRRREKKHRRLDERARTVACKISPFTVNFELDRVL